jgi:serine/threonine protein phosphatase 1
MTVLKKILQRMLNRTVRSGSHQESLEAGLKGPVSPYLPPQHRVYCIGDIHGRLDLLEEMHAMIRRDVASFEGTKMVVYLGDYIDRGAQSCQVLDLLISQPLTGFETVCLLGNHEQAMLDFLRHPREAAGWLSFGGQVTLLSYGVGVGGLVMTQDVEWLSEELSDKLPQSHLDFINACAVQHTVGSYCFVHAGIRPHVKMENQVAGDLLWIRDEFTRSEARHQHIVVHGHTISDEVEWLSNRIGIDTGAYQSGLLTALVLEGSNQRLLQTGRSSSD